MSHCFATPSHRNLGDTLPIPHVCLVILFLCSLHLLSTPFFPFLSYLIITHQIYIALFKIASLFPVRLPPLFVICSLVFVYVCIHLCSSLIGQHLSQTPLPPPSQTISVERETWETHVLMFICVYVMVWSEGGGGDCDQRLRSSACLEGDTYMKKSQRQSEPAYFFLQIRLL